jgi:hypothetical protein
MGHVRGPHPFIELLGRQKTQLERGVLEAEVLAVGEVRNLRGLLVADTRLSEPANATA